MDIATLVGLVGAMGLIVAAMVMGGSLGVFIDVPSILIVFGGATLVALIKFTLGQFLGAGKTAAKAFMFKSVDPNVLIQEIVEVADAARKGGLLSLEDKQVSSPFMQRGMQLLVDGHDPEVVRTLLNKELRLSKGRHESSIKIFEALGDVAPAMGMIGTLIGLVQMLANMSDPKAIGPAMAVALLTTLYGALLASVICLPIADKLKNRNEEEAECGAIVVDGLLAIQAGQNPRVIEQMLKNYLPESKRGTAEA
ncbi:flagellar motor protein PomA [Pokkaliibacter plantistimulans]|uniref:Flagellar motor protein PomA n=1 Tax=Pokkaliibacter plantistimulans TaxID=1635171 RepID=A0ABX5M5X3_9GAMM|nr:flagellar motor protein PomA [Pokkaliibacter plantistimulans]PXF32998.1 flagellar motor protein PomA [Pokkaliibacter plantistimulans]